MDEAQEPVRAQLANGDVLEFPAGTPEAIVTATVKKHLGVKEPSMLDTAKQTVKDVIGEQVSSVVDPVKGVLKGVGQTASDVGKAANTLGEKVFGRKMLPEGATGWADEQLKPTNTAQKAGKFAEQAAEYIAPGMAADALAARAVAKVGGGAAMRIGARAVTNAGGNAALAALHGEDPSSAAAAGAVLPIAGAVAGGVGRAIGNRAMPLVRAGVKPLVSDLKRVAGASREGLDEKANQMARDIIDYRLTSRGKAADMVTDLESQIEKAVQGSTATVDGPQRAMDYLNELQKRAVKTADVDAIEAAKNELLTGTGRLGKEMSHEVLSTAQEPLLVDGKALLDHQGQPITMTKTVKTRAVRPDMTAPEALDLARNSAQWRTSGQWGELKGPAVEADKRVESALRDSVKEGVPVTAPLLQKQGAAIRVRNAMDRQALREGNRNAIGLEGTMALTAATAKGNILGIASHLLRNNQVRAGVFANDLARAVANQDVQTVTRMLSQMGVGVGEGLAKGEQP